jgi:hypothetical protein
LRAAQVRVAQAALLACWNVVHWTRAYLSSTFSLHDPT